MKSKPSYTVFLSNCGNPDYGQDPGRPLCGRPTARWHKCDTIEECASLCLEYIARHDLGGGNWNGGAVRRGRKPYGRISYNGLFWPENHENPGGL